ncbi:receptor-transporting protein 3-like [Eublepharis macularius]|uniref:Receptor-transporting protein 3-like n=1 Tax=Eublepharis macularius TaxID=481883 RepID=A0AA97JLM0_EUBMA|nr:receptor-transporting protein 3-like [Eublepharis macularius]
MYRRGENDNTQSWKEKFVQLMKKHKPQDKWILNVSDDLDLSPNGWYQYGQNHLFARFECSYCHRHWKSAQSVILFHIRLEKKWGHNQGQVKMRKLRQKCRSCMNAEYEKPVFSDQAVETILYNLALKILVKHYGEPKKSPRHCEVEELVEGPHDKSNCEACKHGMCIAAHPSMPTVRPTSLGLIREECFVRPSLISSIEWEEQFMRPASPTLAMQQERNYTRPVSFSQSTGEEECLKLFFFAVLVIALLFFAFSFQQK